LNDFSLKTDKNLNLQNFYQKINPYNQKKKFLKT